MKQTITEGLGRKEVELIASLRDKDIRIFRSEYARKVLNARPQATNKLLSQLVKKKKLLRIERGKYLIIPPEAWKTGEYLEEGIILAASLIKPYYLSYWTALNYYGYTEQPSNTLFVASQKSKRTLNIGQMSFRFIKLNPEKFFGFETTWIGGQQVKLATREKTIVDCLDQPGNCGEITEPTKGLWNGRDELDFEKLVEYAMRMNNSAILKRLGFLMEVLGIKNSDLSMLIKKNIRKGYSPLEPGGQKTGTFNNRWNLLVNVPPKILTEWIKH